MKCDCPTCDEQATREVVAQRPFGGGTVRLKACAAHLEECEDGVRIMLEPQGYKVTVGEPVPT